MIHDGQGHQFGRQRKLNTNPTSVSFGLCEISCHLSKPQPPHLQNVDCDSPSGSDHEISVI